MMSTLPATPHSAAGTGRNRPGVTLIEMMLVVSVMGILMAMVAPRFGNMRLRLQVESAAQQLVRDLNRARTEAVKRNATVYLAKTSTTQYDLQHVGIRDLPGGVTFVSGPDTVKFAAFGPAISGAATYVVTLQGTNKNVQVSASGFANVQ
jgi:prepilin-type N-terminal cleavage/methylation domain-containing protein